MSGGGTEAPVGRETLTGGGGGGSGKKRDSLGTAGSAHLIIKDLGEIHSRLLDHRPVIQGETRYFVKEFEEKRNLRELRVLENLKNMIHETKEHTLPKCGETMKDNLEEVLQRLQAANQAVCRLQQREQERKKVPGLELRASHLLSRLAQMYHDHLISSEKQHLLQWEDFMKEQPYRQTQVDEEHRRAMERLKEQYAEMEKDLTKFSTF
ncbi:biogenesis of lysosome-related organelles complex 1 subunit 5 isoform X1 [Dipodomys merriami]|uniref:biogenesis of lysosome-related organelles complex 1 subunit 5 isoform X1 n=1 Tax=Dipodomys merriami TaxID=94247 RepID=UPI003855A70F